ncbi:hypothetical protein SNOG_04684 [Parastagonospora nodorum SN15]|uniref:Uncharacterized protein n=1 Tax=Phaeosphaeria nodorum (strain SN15 / ATCC MYA-4574 / FGSC 10173) TaxID=321614 RepID=Q0UU80_PHANO|nr:hypothetical protein SNOG_04684 [Parastagonospora nodorum SN15]EAT88444.1 hypothetical protein SNOG_04684 [Parastagonospora nodorum SN15]
MAQDCIQFPKNQLSPMPRHRTQMSSQVYLAYMTTWRPVLLLVLF